MRPRYSSQPSRGFHRRLATRYPAKQSTIRRQSTLDKWDAGTAEIEARMAKQRQTRHTFKHMGTLPACERCGLPIDAIHNGNRVHI